MNKYTHAVEKLTNVLEVLATTSGDARERVALAYNVCAHLRVEELPEKCRKDWEWIMEERTKKGIRKSTASKIAKKFYELYWEVSENTRYA